MSTFGEAPAGNAAKGASIARGCAARARGARARSGGRERAARWIRMGDVVDAIARRDATTDDATTRAVDERRGEDF